MSEKHLLPAGADSGEFKVEIAHLCGIINPLRRAVSAAGRVGAQNTEQIAARPAWSSAATGADEVTAAANAFMLKWGHGLKTISDDANVIADKLQATVNDFLLADTRAGYDLLMEQRAQDAREDAPVTTWVEEHVTKPAGIDGLPSLPSLSELSQGWFD